MVGLARTGARFGGQLADLGVLSDVVLSDVVLSGGGGRVTRLQEAVGGIDP